MTDRGLSIASHRGPYTVRFDDEPLQPLAAVTAPRHYLIDSRVADLYREPFERLAGGSSVLRIAANEHAKTLSSLTPYIEHLVAHGIRRDHLLVAIGGGVIQDITCFLASTMFRGMEWCFYPTTLLAQADSCIGSKSSINTGAVKNLVGTFYPPRQVVISAGVLETLDPADVRSGVGEMIKVHVIEGPQSFDTLAGCYERLFSDRGTMQHFIKRSLAIKQPYIEKDEFDRGPRNIFNYGHSFGHALESATDYAIPHGIGVTIGMDMANFVSWQLGQLQGDDFSRMHRVIRRNYAGFEDVPVPQQAFLTAISRDKKNADANLTLILPGADCRVAPQQVQNDARFAELCRRYFEEIQRA